MMTSSTPLVQRILLYESPDITLLCTPLTNYTWIQVTISSTTPTVTTVATAPTPRLGVRSLPPNVQRSFSNHFVPCIITEMGCSTSPWSNLDADTIQGHVNFIYAGHDYTVEHGDAFHASVSLYIIYQTPMKSSTCSQSNSRIMSIRNKIGRIALMNVQSYLARYTNDQTEEYVRSALVYYGEVPFLYRVFDPTSVRSTKEKGGYKVVRTPCPLLST